MFIKFLKWYVDAYKTILPSIILIFLASFIVFIVGAFELLLSSILYQLAHPILGIIMGIIFMMINFTFIAEFIVDGYDERKRNKHLL